ncbi:MAG: iron-sulfur cluster assembly scaffold protein [bacterium]
MSGQEIYDWAENCFDFYSEVAVRHFMNPVNSGRLEEADGRGCTTSSSIEDFLEISIKVDAATERIEEARFRAVGSPAAMACCSVLTVLIKRRSLGELEAITPQDVVEALGGLPERKRYCAELSLVALKAAVEDYRQRLSFRDARPPQRVTAQ